MKAKEKIKCFKSREAYKERIESIIEKQTGTYKEYLTAIYRWVHTEDAMKAKAIDCTPYGNILDLNPNLKYFLHTGNTEYLETIKENHLYHLNRLLTVVIGYNIFSCFYDIPPFETILNLLEGMSLSDAVANDPLLFDKRSYDEYDIVFDGERIKVIYHKDQQHNNGTIQNQLH